MKSVLLAAGIAVAAVSAASAADTFTIGLSNGWVGSEWRTQMIEEAQAAAKAWADKGVTVNVVVQSSNVDVQGQIGNVRNFINQGVNAIIIDPNSPTAFDPIFAQAKAKGILVISTDAEVSSKDAIYVGIDQKDWAVKSAEWLAKTLNGKGSVVAIVFQMAGGLRASMGYCGCATIEEMKSKAEFVEITSAGVRESHVHDVQITKEAPNYRAD